MNSSKFCFKNQIYIQEWKSRKCNQYTTKWMSKVIEPKYFSEKFFNIINRQNIENIFGLDDIKLQYQIFESLVNNEMMYRFNSNNDSIQNLECILDDDRYIYCEISVSNNNDICWKKRGVTTQYGSWIDCFQDIFTLPRQDALATLARIVQMSETNLCTLSSRTHAAESTDHRRLNNNIPQCIHLHNVPQEQAIVKLAFEPYAILGRSNQIIGAMAIYEYNGSFFCIPATVGKQDLCIGKYKPTAHFLNQHLIEKYPNAIILLFQDARAAIKVQRIFNSHGIKNHKFIITTHLGRDLSILPWNFFSWRKIFFIPAPTKESLAMVKAYTKYCEGIHVDSIKIANRFILPFSLNVDSCNKQEGLTNGEAYILKSCNFVDNIKYIVPYLEELESDTMIFEDFEKLYQQLGIFQAPKGQGNTFQVATKFTMLPTDPALSPALAMTDTDITVNHIIQPGITVMVVGMKNIGKTQFSYSLIASCLGRKCGIWFLDNKANAIISNIYIVDSEVSVEKIDKNLEQYQILNEKEKRLFVLSIYDKNLPDFANNFMIIEKAFREGLLNELVQKKCRVLILDNLSTLMGDNINYGKYAQDVIEWIKN